MLGELLGFRAPDADIGRLLVGLDHDPAGEPVGLAQLGLADYLDFAERTGCVERWKAVEPLQMQLQERPLARRFERPEILNFSTFAAWLRPMPIVDAAESRPEAVEGKAVALEA